MTEGGDKNANYLEENKEIKDGNSSSEIPSDKLMLATVVNLKSEEDKANEEKKQKVLQELLQCLKRFEHMDMEPQDSDTALQLRWMTDKLLDSMFYTGVYWNPLDNDIKTNIGHLLALVIEPIVNNIECICCLAFFNLDSSLFRKRSAMQYIFDLLGDVLINGVKLSTMFIKKGAKEAISKLDNQILQAKNFSKIRSENAEAFYDLTDDSDLDEGDLVPKNSHNWWLKD